jgi:hypothetical protein
MRHRIGQLSATSVPLQRAVSSAEGRARKCPWGAKRNPPQRVPDVNYRMRLLGFPPHPAELSQRRSKQLHAAETGTTLTSPERTAHAGKPKFLLLSPWLPTLKLKCHARGELGRTSRKRSFTKRLNYTARPGRQLSVGDLGYQPYLFTT